MNHKMKTRRDSENKMEIYCREKKNQLNGREKYGDKSDQTCVGFVFI